ncbi:MAG: Glu-tRNA(Gln) amidotransferase subunit GatD [Candidatus Woesearchaeota archaeon]
MQPKPGDSVRIITKDSAYEGLLMPRPKILEKGIAVIKLDNGYNIGIEEGKIQRIELLEEYKPKRLVPEKIIPEKGLPTVAVLSFGGTISAKVDYRTGGTYADYTAQDFVQMMPELKKVANIRAEKVKGMMSEDFTPKDWKDMANSIAKELNTDTSGVVVSQGTDTLHFSTAAMSFMLRNLTKPVIFTAAQRSIDRGSSDAFMNLFCAINAAAKFDGAVVATCLHSSIDDSNCMLIRGSKVRKMHTSRRDAFRPMNESPLASIDIKGNIDVLNPDYPKLQPGKVEVDDKFEEKTALIMVYPGMEPKVIDFYVKEGYKGIVLSATALGHVPTDTSKKNILPNIKHALDSGLPVVVSSQSLYGRVHPHVYTNLRKLSVELSCIFVEDMLPEVAYVKLGWVLGHTNDPKKIKEMMLKNYAGEMTLRSDKKSFLY